MAGYHPVDQGLYRTEYEKDSCGIGFVAHIKGKKSNEVVRRGLMVLSRMEHRSAESADNKTGDGSGIMIQVPHIFYREEVTDLPEFGCYGTGLIFLPQELQQRQQCCNLFQSIVQQEGLEIITFREVPTDDSFAGEIAIKSQPKIQQVFIKSKENSDTKFLEWKLFVVRKRIEHAISTLEISQADYFYIPSLSTKTIVFKGMFMPNQIEGFFKDLQDERVVSAIALVHSRFSTNTFPSWSLAQPFRFIAHNGEINTINSNRLWEKARESEFILPEFKEDLEKILPIIEPGKSDSASFDNLLELLVATGKDIPQALMMMIPESFSSLNPLPDSLKYFYEYNSTFMEAWDGPASIVFSDGRYAGGTLDRNGLRPSRYVITSDDVIVMSSEMGVLTFDPEKIITKGRLQPGKLLLVDTVEGRIIPNDEIKETISTSKPYMEWVENGRIRLADIPQRKLVSTEIDSKELLRLHHLFGYNAEDVYVIVTPMANSAQEPTGSMGTDTPLAVFSDKPQKLFNFFKQVFAQVTNPAIDPIREELVMTLTSYIGNQKNLLIETSEHCNVIQVKNPILTNSDLYKILNWQNPNFKSQVFPMTFPKEDTLEVALEKLCKNIEDKVDKGFNIIVLSDKLVNENNLPIPALLGCSAVHHHLISVGKRMKASIIVETGEACEVMHYALLFGYGATAVNPYLAFATVHNEFKYGNISPELTYEKAEDNYIKAVNKGLLKILSKMGTSTLRSYRGGQVFEAVGLSQALLDKYFCGTISKIGGIEIEEIEQGTRNKYKKYMNTPKVLEHEGVYKYRKEGEKHAWNPDTIRLLQWATRTNSYERFKEFSTLVNKENQRPHVIRGMFDFIETPPISIEEVESIESIRKRLVTGAMSFGSLSKEVHEAIAIAMNKIGSRSNSGEGGEDSERFNLRPDGTLARSAIKQVASGRFGVTSNYLANADEIQIKIAQGAKPGEGGQLAGHKVDKIIAKTRHSTSGVTLISPPPHHDIYSIEDLAQLIFDLKNANPKAKISVKLVSESGVGTIAAGVVKAHADLILISGYDGGTGASPISSIKHAGLPWEIGLSETHQTLLLNKLRGRVKLQTDGQLKTGRDIVIAAMLGAEEFGFATSVLIVLGCIMMRKCHINTCPVGVATQDEELRKRFNGAPDYIVNFFTFLAQEVREIMAQLGIKEFNQLVGRTDLLQVREVEHWKARKLDLTPILFRPKVTEDVSNYCVEEQQHKLHKVLDKTLIERSLPALNESNPVNIYIDIPIKNINRAVGTMLSYEISTRFGEKGLPDHTINCTFTGSAGQSFGAFLAKGVTFNLIGDSNDYLGKGLSGGKIIVMPPKDSKFKSNENIIVGNTVLYGATSGELYVSGVAGERFCVRNSGATAVVEGIGDHGAEYMTGGRLVVLGKVGRNFAAGMSGGIAYVMDTDGDLEYFCNKGMVDILPVRDYDDQDYLIEIIQKHRQYTGSLIAKEIIDNWYSFVPKFKKVISFEYRRSLEELKISMIDEKLKKIREQEQLEESR